MIESERKTFFTLLAGIHAFYGRDLSDFAGNVWWQSMAPFDFAAVKDAFNRHCVNPDTGQFMPKPADVIRMLAGSSIDSAMVAWAKVDRALRTVGTYASVVFDDALIHRVLDDMGGWIPLGAKTEEEWPFVGNEFRTRYKGYRGRSETPDYPRRLIGIAEASNAREGHKIAPPVMIGDAIQAQRVLEHGAAKPLLTFTRIAA